MMAPFDRAWAQLMHSTAQITGLGAIFSTPGWKSTHVSFKLQPASFGQQNARRSALAEASLKPHFVTPRFAADRERWREREREREGGEREREERERAERERERERERYIYIHIYTGCCDRIGTRPPRIGTRRPFLGSIFGQNAYF